jgi:heme-degrading monooxygenase HmoA
MYARSTTIQADPQQLDAGIAVVRDEVMPAMATMPGYVGLSMLCDRMSGRCIVTTSWDSEESMHASESAVHDLRRRAADAMGGAQPEVAEWEIAMMHRMHGAHDGCVTRVVWGESDPARADDSMQTMRMAVLPKMEELPGFCAMSLFVDRESGRSAMVTAYDSREQMQEATDRAMEIRRESTSAMDVRVTDMAEFELVMHHLRVPEMA